MTASVFQAFVSTITGITLQSMRSLGNLIPWIVQQKDALSCHGHVLSVASLQWHYADVFPGVHSSWLIYPFEECNKLQFAWGQMTVG